MKILFLFFLLRISQCQEEPQDGDGVTEPGEFNPKVTATCRQGTMAISIKTRGPFWGSVHPRQIRSAPCIHDGQGANETVVSYNMIASPTDPDYCGITYNSKQDERSVQIAVRAHRTLELAEDKLYVVTCGRAGSNSKNETVRMGFYGASNAKLNEVVYGRAYKLRLEVQGIHEESAIRVRSCFSFGGVNTSVPLVDDLGCAEQGVMSRWSYTGNNVAEATIYSMFRFQDSKRLNFQCDVLVCPASECPTPVCNSAVPITSARRDTNETSFLAATTVSVLDPGDKAEAIVEECSACPKWLMWLAITLGVLFLLMLLVNLFLCSALTCTCTRTELVEKEPSVLEDYDPYRSWAGSQYGGSRYSLNNGNKPVYSVSAESNGSDHYATVPSRHSPSRPGSRYSQKETSPYSQNRKL